MASNPSPVEKKGSVPEQPQQSISTQILDKFVTSVFDENEFEFLPDGLIEKIITPKAIIKELSGEYQFESEDLDLQTEPTKQEIIGFVLPKAIKVFASLVLCQIQGQDLEKVIRRFIKAGLSTVPCLSKRNT